MILPQPPAFQIFIPVETVSAADMTTEGFSSITAIQANHVIVTYRLPYRNRWSVNFLGLTGLSKLSKGSMYGSDKI